MSDTAFLVLNFNGLEFLPQCLGSLSSQSNDPDIFLIDNCSTDNSLDFVINNFPKIKIVKNTTNGGIGKAFNPVLKKIIRQYDYIGLFNTDIDVDKKWLDTSKEFLKKNPDIYAVTSFTQSPDGRQVDTLGGTILNLPLGIFAGFMGDRPISEVDKLYFTKPFPVFFGLITGILVKSQAFAECGFFDESYFMYFEDIDFCWRLLLHGKKIYCHPKAIIKHYGHGSIKTLKSQIFVSQKSETNLLSTLFNNLSPPLLLILLPVVTLSRLMMALAYIFATPEITKTKLTGIFIFYSKLFSGSLFQSRHFSQSLRRCTDIEVFSNNPQSLVNFASVFQQAIPWLTHSNKYKIKA
ncbi:MAG TPA: glycosyltransferase family 2 protein [Patescibacteria group bacterium]